MKLPLALSLLSLTLPAPGLDLRSYNGTVHDRFTGFPAAPVMNPTFLFDATKFTGVGWGATQAHKEYAALSPRHLICAAHPGAPPPVPTDIRFIASDGSLVQRSVVSLTPIPTDTTGNSDILIITLDSPLPLSVKPVAYLNLGAESNYTGKSLIVLGFTNKAGKGTIGAFGDEDVDGAGPNGTTRTLSFTYLGLGSDPHECHFFTGGGDSGSPSFVSQGGQPALVGIHLGVSSLVPGVYVNYDTFVPHYAAKIDTVLAPSGYRMRPAVFTPTTISFAATQVPAALFDQSQAASLNLALENTGANPDGNLAITLNFPAAVAPSSITATGCVVESLSAGVWSIRKATVAAGEDIAVTASWTAVPAVSSIAATVEVASDATTAATYPLSIPVAQSYTTWAQGLTEGDQEDDPDGDGWANLLEYAFGTPAEGGTFTTPAGQRLDPQPADQSGIISITFPEREHASLLGLSYVVETSTDMNPDPWTTTLPAGFATSTQPYAPPIPGFVKRTITWPQDGPRRFARVKVELEE